MITASAPASVRPERLAGLVDEDHGACRRAGHERATEIADRGEADVDRVETVDILVRRDCFQHPRRADRRGQRQLDKDAVDGRIGVERGDKGEQLGFASRSRQRMLDGMKSRRLGGAPFRADIDLARRVGADEHDRQAGGYALGGQIPNLGGDPLEHALRYRLAVQYERAPQRLCIH